jgi:acetyl-CoA carboxylase carboxyltransferase component
MYFSGVECMISANVPTINGGAANQITLKKYQRIDQIVTENRLPHIQLVETVRSFVLSSSSSLPYTSLPFN